MNTKKVRFSKQKHSWKVTSCDQAHIYKFFNLRSNLNKSLRQSSIFLSLDLWDLLSKLFLF